MPEWRKHPDYNYEVSSEGGVRHAVTKRDRKLHPDRDGYMRFNAKLPGRCCMPLKVAILVCEVFHGQRPFPKVEVCHGSLGQQCDWAENLRWGTHAENLADRSRTGWLGSRLEIGDAVRIRALAADGVSQLRIAKEFAISPSNVRSILNWQTWA